MRSGMSTRPTILFPSLLEESRDAYGLNAEAEARQLDERPPV